MAGWIEGRPGAAQLGEQLLAPLWVGSPGLTRLLWLSAAGVGWLGLAVTYTLITGIGTWGNNVPVSWAFGILHFVWWIGIGHAGTFISAILLLLEQPWRQSINRVAEAMTLFALVCAGLFPLLHLGRAWYFYWLLPYPATMRLWPQYRSALVWDVLAVLTYTTVSLLFWYLGLVPDLAAARDRAPERWRRRIYGVFALGWRGSVRHWRIHRIAYGLLAGLATPLVVSVHSIIGLDFTSAMVPGWYTTMFPPFFVVGAIHSGFAMVFLLLLPLRAAYGAKNVVTDRHLDAMAKVMLTTACLMGYFYALDHFGAWYGGSVAERHTVDVDRPLGHWAWLFWLMVAGNVVIPQALWFGAVRRNVRALAGISAGVLTGMWIERFVIIVQSLAVDRLPSSWGNYVPTVVDFSLLIGTLSLFSFLFLLFIRFVPCIPIAEVKALAHEEHV